MSPQLASAGISQVYGQGGTYYQGQGIGANGYGADGVNRSDLFGAAADTSNAVGQMMYSSYPDQSCVFPTCVLLIINGFRSDKNKDMRLEKRI